MNPWIAAALAITMPVSAYERLAEPTTQRASRATAAIAADTNAVIRINQVGYAPRAVKVAVVCALSPVHVSRFTVETESGRVVFGPVSAQATGAFGPCVETYRLNFTTVRASGRFRLRAGVFASPVFRISENVYAGLADTLMSYMRQQRSGYNPFLRDSAHKRDGFIVDHPTRTGEFINVITSLYMQGRQIEIRSPSPLIATLFVSMGFTEQARFTQRGA